MKKTFSNFLIILILSVVIGFVSAWFYGKNIPIVEILAILETLTNISAILFGVMGVWLSLIWGKNLEEQNEGILYIKKTLVSSFSTISVFLICKQTYPIFVQIEFFYKIKCICRFFLFFISIELTFFTIISVLFVILSFDFFSFDKNVSDKKLQELKDKNNKLFWLTQGMEHDD